MTPSDRFDAIVVGSGAGGSAAAYQLAMAGVRVLLVEKGGRLPRDGSTLDVKRVVHGGAYKSAEVWRDAQGRALIPEEHFNVGGKTKWYGAALARFAPREFAADEERGYLGWPLHYSDLAPYYGRVEALLGIREFACEPGLSAILARLSRVSRWRAEPLPLGLDAAITADPYEAAHFDGFASARGYKADGEEKLLARVAHLPNLTLLHGSTVASLLAAPARPKRVVGVRLDDGREFYAREVVLAAGAMHSPRLLERFLASNGLTDLPAARSVGRNFKLHLLTAVLAFGTGTNRDLLRKTMLLRDDAMPHSSVQPLGFDGELIATLIPRFVPRRVARTLGGRAYGFFLQTEDGSSSANRVTAGTAAGELPTVDYDARRTPLALAEHRALVARFRRDLLRAGYPNAAQRISLAGTAHACGTLVTGSDEHRSVVDADGRVHGLEGLTVADGSVLPRSSSVNPALTIYAFALRAAERVAARLLDHANRLDSSIEQLPAVAVA
jgi:choline dehydrogenase-like flavoprotein